jgi:hypothetical protein
MQGRQLFAIAALCMTSATCAHGHGPATSDSTPLPAVRVHVNNHYKTEMEIYATGSGTTQRLGLVAPGLEREFDVPQHMVVAGLVTFTAHPSGVGPTVRSDEIRIRPGDMVDFDIATNLFGTQAWVRP